MTEMSILPKSLDRVAKKFKTAYGALCAVLGTFVVLVSFSALASGAIEAIIRLLTPAKSLAVPPRPMSTAIPTPEATPLLLGIISLGVAIPVHKLGHSSFVKQDEKLEKASPWKRIQVASAGPVSNILLGILCLGLAFLLVNPLPGLYIRGVRPNSAADNAGLTPGTRLVSVNGVEINNYETLANFMEGTDPGQTISLKTGKNRYHITLGSCPIRDTGYLGVEVIQSPPSERPVNPLALTSMAFRKVTGQPLVDQYAHESVVPWVIIRALEWVFALNLLVGVLSLLLLKPLDGGRIVEGISEKLTSRSTAKAFTKVISVVTLAFIVLSLTIYL